MSTFQRILTISHICVLGVFISSCAPVTQESRIEKHHTIFKTLPPKHQELVKQGNIDKGMSKDAVFLAWGEADGETDQFKNNKRNTRWDYTRLTPVYRNTIQSGIILGHNPGYRRRCGSYGYRSGFGGYLGRGYGYGNHIGIGTSIHYRKTNAASVFFENNRVSAWEIQR